MNTITRSMCRAVGRAVFRAVTGRHIMECEAPVYWQALRHQATERLREPWESRKECESTRYFVHIPKTGGMTVHAFLRACAPDGPGAPSFFDYFFLDDVVNRLDAARQCTVFSGHFLGFLDPLLGRETRKATVLRDPTERAISYFLHVRRDPTLPHHEVFVRSRLCDVLADPTLRSFAVNGQARWLASLHDDPAWFRHTLEVRQPPGTDEELLNRARAGLAMIETVGLYEQLPEFLTRLTKAWSLNSPGVIPRENFASNRHEVVISDEERLMLRDYNRVDYELYEEVASRLRHEAPGPRQ
jgi:hypothetical protein